MRDGIISPSCPTTPYVAGTKVEVESKHFASSSYYAATITTVNDDADGTYDVDYGDVGITSKESKVTRVRIRGPLPQERRARLQQLIDEHNKDKLEKEELRFETKAFLDNVKWDGATSSIYSWKGSGDDFTSISNNKKSLPTFVWIELRHMRELDLSNNKLGTFPVEIAQLDKLKRLDLSRCSMSGHVPSLAKLVELEYLDLNNNSFSGPLLDGLVDLVHLCVLNMSNCFDDENSTSAKREVPASFGKLVELKELNMSKCQLVGTLPESLIGLVHLRYLDVSNNPGLEGSLPSLDINYVNIDNTAMTSVTIKTKPLEYWWDYCFVIAHVLVGYADLVSDILAINALNSEGRRELMGLNVVFLLLNVLVDVSLSYKFKDKVLAFLQLQPLVQAFDTLQSGRSTPKFVRSKKIDAIFRAFPSMVLQLFGLLISLANISSKNFITLVFSICISIVGSCTTMATLAPKSGSSMFSLRFVIHFLYYVSDVVVRISIFVMFFVSLYAYGFIPLAIELLARAIIIRIFHGGRLRGTNLVIESLLWFGSDACKDPSSAGTFVGSSITMTSQFVALIIFNTLTTPTLDMLRHLNASRNVTIISCLLVLSKFYLAYFIGGWQVQEALMNTSSNESTTTTTNTKTKMPSEPVPSSTTNSNTTGTSTSNPLFSPTTPSTASRGVEFATTASTTSNVSTHVTQVSINTV